MANEYIEEYKTLLHGEVGAVETYKVAMKSATSAEAIRTLELAQQSHQNRVNKLKDLLVAEGGVAEETAGLWGPFEKFVQGTVSTERDAIAMLEEAEAERLVNYEMQSTVVEGEVRDVIKTQLLPAQHESHLMLAGLLKQLEPAVTK